jgi:hypothetical protein
MTFGASLKAPPALMKNGKNESGQLGLKLDVQGNKGVPYLADPRGCLAVRYPLHKSI